MDSFHDLDQRVAKDFHSQATEARRALEDALSNRTLDVDDERLAVALLTLADGDLARLEHFAQVAQRDTRDVLF